MSIKPDSWIRRMAELNGNRIPDALDRLLTRADGDASAVAQAGVEWATLQCEELIRGGAPGIHLFTLNRSPATQQILTQLRERLDL